MTLDARLRDALARKEPPSDFHARVMARIGEAKTSEANTHLGSGSSQPARPLYRVGQRWLAAAAAVMIAVSGERYYHHRVMVMEAERATRDVRLALEIASEKLATVQRHIQESSQRAF